MVLCPEWPGRLAADRSKALLKRINNIINIRIRGYCDKSISGLSRWAADIAIVIDLAHVNIFLEFWGTFWRGKVDFIPFFACGATRMGLRTSLT